MDAVWEARKHVNWGLGIKVLGAISLVFLTAWVTYLFTARLNVETALQQQQMAAVQQFEESGARLDTSLSLFADALLDGSGVAEARKEVRTAIILHASQANALRDVVGNGNVDQYLRGLAELREFADNATDPRTAMVVAQQHVNLMDYRVRMVELARRNIYS